MKLIWVAVDPSISNCDELIHDIATVVENHGGRVDLLGIGLEAKDIHLGKRFALNDLVRGSRKVYMGQAHVHAP